MLKDHEIIEPVEKAIENAAEDAVQHIFSMYGWKLKGREENITAQLASEITLHLMDKVKERLNGEVINGVHFWVYLFRKREEKEVGADLAGVFRFEREGRVVTKAYLAQAKVAKVILDKNNNEIVVVKDPRLRSQVRNMLSFTSSAYVFLYSPLGVRVVSAHVLNMLTHDVLRTDEVYYHGIGWLYSEMFKSFVGDHRLACYLRRYDLEQFAKDVGVSNVLMIKGVVEDDKEKYLTWM